MEEIAGKSVGESLNDVLMAVKANNLYNCY